MFETKIRIPSVLGEEKKVIERLEKVLKLAGCIDADCMDIKTATAEACLNAIEHGNNLDQSLCVQVHIKVTENYVAVEVCDQGRGAELKALTCSNPSNQKKTGGLGLYFIDKLMDEWKFFYNPEEKLFCVSMNKNIGKGR